MNTLPQILSLTPADLDRICAAATAAYPAECCGLLAGVIEARELWRVTQVIPTENLLAAERNDRFEIDPIMRFSLMRRLRGGRERLIGHYHSHPERPAYPSAIDHAMVFEAELIWMIVAVKDGRAGATKAYRLDGTAAVHRMRIAICRHSEQHADEISGQDLLSY